MQENGFMLSLVGTFANMDGFKKFLDLIKIGAMGKDFKCPVIVICYAIHCFSRLQEFGVKGQFYLDLS